MIDGYFGTNWVKWEKRDQKRANAEGWAIIAVDGDQLEVQKLDEAEGRPFYTDGAAVFHVYDKALSGSMLHRKALAVVLADKNIRRKKR